MNTDVARHHRSQGTDIDFTILPADGDQDYSNERGVASIVF